MASWLDKYGSTPAPASQNKGGWMDKYWQDFSNVEGGFTFEDRPADVPVAPFDPSRPREQTYPEQPGLLARTGESLGRMAQPLVSGVTAPLAAGAESIPAQAQGVVGGAQRAYAELTPDWMYPFSSPEEIEQIRETMGNEGAQRYVEAQQEQARIREEALARGADPYSLDVATALPQFGLMAAGSMVNPALGVGLLASTAAPQQYAAYREQGLSPEQAALAATTATAAESVTSLVPASLINRASTMGRAPAAAAIGAAEGSQETSTALIQQAQDTALGLRDGIDVGEAIYQGTVGLGIGAGTGALLGRTGIPAFDAGVQSIERGLPEARENAPEPVSPPQATDVAPEAETPSESVTQRSSPIVDPVQSEGQPTTPDWMARWTNTPVTEESLTPEEIDNAITTLDPSRGRRNTAERIRAEGDVLAQMVEEGSEGNNNRFAELMAERGFSTPVSQQNTTQEATEAPGATTPTPEAETASQRQNVNEIVEEPASETSVVGDNEVDANEAEGVVASETSDPLSFLDTPPTNKAAEVAARGEVIREMAAEGWTGSQAKRRAEMARRMTERGFPETPLPDATARTERETQATPLQQGEFARVWNEDTETWTDARVENVEGDNVTVSFRDGTTRSFPDTEVERGERNAPAWVSEMPLEAPVTTSESVSVPEATQTAEQAQTAPQSVTDASNVAQESAQPTAAKPIEAQTARDVLRQLREERRVGDKARFDELMQARGVEQTPPAASLASYDPARSIEEIDTKALVGPRIRANRAADHNAFKPATTAKQALDVVSQRVQGNPRYTRLVEALRKNNLDNVAFSVVDPEEIGSLPVNLGTDVFLDQKRNVEGVYDPNTDTIYIKGAGWRHNGTKDEVVLHELVHAATLKKIDGVRKGTIKDKETIAAATDLARLWRTFQKQTDNFSEFDPETKFMLEYAALNPDEFVAVTQTNPQVQAALKEKGLWDRFVDLVRRILGLSRIDKPLLDSILDAGLRVIEAQGDAETGVAQPAASEAPPTTDPRIEAIRTSEQGPEGAAQKRMRAVSNVVKGLLNPYGVAGKNVEKIRQVESTGRINEALYLAGVPSRRLVVEAKAAGVNNRVVLRALRSGNLSQLPKTVQTAAKAIQTELQSIHFAALEEYLKNRPANQKLSKSEMDKLNKVVSDNFQLPEIYRRDIDPNYSTNLIRNWKKGKLSAEDKQVVENALNDVLAQVLIPQDLTQRVEQGRVGKQDLVDYHQKWVGTGVSGKSVEQLTEELNNTRDMFLREMKTEDAVTTWALNSLAGANPPLNLSRYPSQRYDLTEGNVPESIRKLWGEVDDVAINVQHAWAKAASQLGQYRMMNTLAEQWKADGTATETPQGKNTIRIDGKEAGALRGLFVSPAKADAIKSITTMFQKSQDISDAILRGEKEFAGAVAQGVSKSVRTLAGFTKAQAIIGNAANWWFNLAGSPETLIASGNVPIANRRGGVQGLKEGVQGLLGTTLISRRRETNPFTAELLRAGMTESAQVGEIANLMRDAEIRQTIESSSSLTDGVTKLAQLVKKGGLEITNFYSILDLWAPAVTYFKNKQDIKDHWDRTGVEYTDAELEREAAHMTKNTTVTMSYIPQVIRLTEAHGLSYVLPYLFAAHRAVIANQAIGARQLWEGIRSGDIDYARVGLARTVGNAAMAASFFARMSPFYGLAALPFVAAGNAMRYLTDSDDEEEKAVLEAIRQDDRLKLSNPVVLQKDDNGTYYIVDMNRVLVNEPGLQTAEVAIKAFTDWTSGEASAEDAAGSILKQLADNVFPNASLMRMVKGAINPASQSTMRREAREMYDEWVGDNPVSQRLQLGTEILLPRTNTAVWNEMMREEMGRPSPDTIQKLKALGFPIYEINPGRDAGGENYFTGTKRFAADYQEARTSLKQSVGLLANVNDNDLEAAYVDFARKQLESYRRTAPVIEAAFAQGFTPEEIEQRMKDNGTTVPKNTRTAMLQGFFELPEVSDEFFKGELRMARQEAAKYPNPEDKLAEWEDMYVDRREALRDIRIILQEQIDEGVFK